MGNKHLKIKEVNPLTIKSILFIMGSGSSKSNANSANNPQSDSSKSSSTKENNNGIKPQPDKQDTSQGKTKQNNTKNEETGVQETQNDESHDEAPAAIIKPETTPLHGYEPGYADFPTSTSLRSENVQYEDHIKKQKAKVDSSLPSPNGVPKSAIFEASKFQKLDEKALQVSCVKISLQKISLINVVKNGNNKNY